MPKPHHLDQLLVDDSPKLIVALTALGDFLKTSYFYPGAAYEKCEDDRAPAAWESVSKWFEPYIKVSPVLSCPALSCPVLSCPVLSCSFSEF
jgi:hypothetical protein